MAKVVDLASRRPVTLYDARGRALARSTDEPRHYRKQRVGSIHRHSAAGMKPERLKSILRDTERGEMERWADLAEAVLRTDPHVRSVADTVIRSVVASELRVTAARVRPEWRALAEEQAHFVRESLSLSMELGETLAHLLHGYLVGISGAEHQWERQNGEWHSVQQERIYTRDFEWCEDWVPKVRSYARNGLTGHWIRTDDEPARWLIHEPTAIGTTPNLAGALQAVVWPWLFKKWAQIYQQTGLERFANPLLVGKMAPNAHDVAREEFFEELDNLMAASVAVLEQEQTIEVIQAGKSPADSWNPAIAQYNADMTKALLGSTLNVEIAEPGGNRAAAESQASITIIPRLQSIATALAVTVRRQWFAPLLRFNAVKWGGRLLPPPEASFILKQEEGPKVTPELIAAGVITVNELREAHGFDPLETGGDRIVKPIMKSPLPTQPAAPKPAGRGKQGSFDF